MSLDFSSLTYADWVVLGMSAVGLAVLLVMQQVTRKTLANAPLDGGDRLAASLAGILLDASKRAAAKQNSAALASGSEGVSPLCPATTGPATTMAPVEMSFPSPQVAEKSVPSPSQ